MEVIAAAQPQANLHREQVRVGDNKKVKFAWMNGNVEVTIELKAPPKAVSDAPRYLEFVAGGINVVDDAGRVFGKDTYT